MNKQEINIESVPEVEVDTTKVWEIREINIKIEHKELKNGIVFVPYVLIETPYLILSDKNGTRRIWTKNKKKIILYYLYEITKIKWFIKKYNEQPR